MKSKWNIQSLSKLAGASAIALIAAGCGGNNAGGEDGNTATGKSVDQNFRDTAGSVGNAGSAVGNAVSGAGEVASNVAVGAGNVVAGAGKAIVGGAKNADDALIQTPKVKAALINNPAMKSATGIDVTSSDKNVTITGTVKTQQQKTLATAIAKKNSPGYNVVNNLKVVK